MTILVLNSGSSSIKFSLYQASGSDRQKLLEGEADGVGVGSKAAKFWIKDTSGQKIVDQKPPLPDLTAAFSLIQQAIARPEFPRPTAIGHRMVSGGPKITENQLLSPDLITDMERYTSFAPLHAPAEIELMRKAIEAYPKVPNYVCFDGYFHRTLPQITSRLPIPSEFADQGLRRFGFHGLSYESIVAHLRAESRPFPSRLIVAHLGNGASVCAIRDGQSVDTSMGLTPTGGILSGTRTGDIDPGVVIFLLRQIAEKTVSATAAANQLETIVNKHSGLLGVSNLSNDMRTIREAIAKGDQNAKLAADQFSYVLRKYIGGYITVLGGLDMLVFTGGIGENDPDTRQAACANLESLGIRLDHGRNDSRGDATISAEDSPVEVRVIPPAEDLMIVNHVCRLSDRSGFQKA